MSSDWNKTSVASIMATAVTSGLCVDSLLTYAWYAKKRPMTICLCGGLTNPTITPCVSAHWVHLVRSFALLAVESKTTLPVASS